MKLALILALLLTACTKMEQKKSNLPNPVSQKTDNKLEVEKLGLEGAYMAVLDPVNPSLTGPLSGSANFSKTGPELTAYIRVVGATPNLIHEQRFYQASQCPSVEHDLNGDGFIDITEASSVLGIPLFPLDYDLTSIEKGFNEFPVADVFGNYWYEQIVNYDDLLHDLLDPFDHDPEDDFYKSLLNDKSMQLDDTAVLIMGVAASSGLPDSVASTGGYANFQTLPIACGILKRVYHLPGKVEDGDPDVVVTGGQPGGPEGEYDNAPNIYRGEGKIQDYGDDDSVNP